MLAMNRLPLELNRLYGLGPIPMDGAAAQVVGGTGDGLRAAVLAVVLPAGWEQLSSVWRGVQSDLGLPAPAIAVSGADALQLWFSFASPTSSSAAARFLQGLRARYLAGVGSSQVRVYAEAAGLPMAPCVEITPQRWSAFVTHDSKRICSKWSSSLFKARRSTAGFWRLLGSQVMAFSSSLIQRTAMPLNQW
jgi:hypothetical protein